MSVAVNVCFHGIGSPGRRLENGEDRYWVTKDQYLSLLDVLVEDPRVRISFDDGNVSDVEVGLPGLLDRGLTATFFVLAGRLEQPGSLSCDDVRFLTASGMQIGTHGMHHRPWRGLGAAERRIELVEARNAISSAAGTPVVDTALPLGRYDRELLGQLRELGYRSVHTSDRRWARDGSWLQPRFSARCDDTPESVRREVLTRPSLRRRTERTMVCLAKRWR